MTGLDAETVLVWFIAYGRVALQRSGEREGEGEKGGNREKPCSGQHLLIRRWEAVRRTDIVGCQETGGGLKIYIKF